MNSVVRTIDLTKRFGKTKALDGVNIAVQEGNICGLVGVNGTGKTTTIKIRWRGAERFSAGCLP